MTGRSTMAIRLAAIQAHALPGQIEANLKHAEGLIEQAGAGVITRLATQVGRLGDVFGRVRMYESGFLIFMLGSLACTLAWNEPRSSDSGCCRAPAGHFVPANSGTVIPACRKRRAHDATSPLLRPYAPQIRDPWL